MMKKVLTSTLVAFVMVFMTGFQVYSQISQGGTPPSFLERTISQDIELKTFPAPNVEELLAEDEIKMNQGYPLRVGTSVMVNLDIENAGTWTELSDGSKIWRLALKSEGSLATGVYFDEYYLPEGAELFIYDANHQEVLGAFTSFNYHESGLFTSQLVPGDEIILEYYMPEYLNEMPDLSISHLAYNYKEAAFPYLNEGGDRASWPCMINVNCEEGDDWQNEKRGVVKQYMKIGWSYYLCSGSMINNTEWDRTPYVLTAAHCGHGASASDLNQWVFYFNYEASTCTGSWGSSSQTVTGAQLRAWNHIPSPNNIDGSDFYLVELNSDPPTSYDVYFNGWDRRDIPGDSGVSIHHPDGDIKKISTYAHMVSSSWWTGVPSHWQLWWIETTNGRSIVQGGSSGSPVFNEHKNIIGDLTGGYASNSCSSPSPAFYGKVYWSWDKNGSTAAYQLKPWLDPNDLGWEFCDGVSWEDSPPVVDFEADETNPNMGQEVQFTDLSENNPNEWMWLFEGADIDTSYDENPVVTYVDSGYFSVQLIAENPDGQGELLKEDYMYVNYVELPVADFTSDTTMLSPFETTSFYDESTGDPFEWEWTFEGGTPSSSTDQNPEDIKYYASGLYDVTLTATNGGGSNTIMKEGYINVVWVGIDENKEVQNIKLFPNPTKGEFTLEFLNLDYTQAEVQVFDLGGNLVKTYKSENSNETLNIDIQGQPEGVYYLNIKVDDKIYIDKVSLVK